MFVFLTLARLRPVDIDQVVVSMTLKINKKQLLWNALGSCGVERLLDEESLMWKYLTLSLKFQVGQINRTIILGQKKIHEVG
jgi:hypothetical protein